jgi:SAM-dependent methyltransferase
VTSHPKVLNLGCGTKASQHPDVLNIDWSIHLRIRKNPVLWALRRQILDRERRIAIESLPTNIRLWNLRKGIPFPEASVDAVYHSHLIEHLDRAVAPEFMREVLRVLKPGGIHRIAAPDFERGCRLYIDDVAKCDADPGAVTHHDEVVADVIQQMVWTEAFGTSQRPPVRRYVENLLLGGAARRGQTHRWMYDRHSLPQLLRDVGFREARAMPWNESEIEAWKDFGLEVDESGGEYRSDSFYVEAVK